MRFKTNYDKPQCEVLKLEEQSVLCSSAVESMEINDPWVVLGPEEEW